MKNILFLFCCFMMTGLHAQQKPVFKTILQGGLLAGSSAEAVTLQVVNGFEFKRLYAGAGIGLDYYMQRGVPLFADLRYRFAGERKSFFMYADAGAHLPWIKNKEERNIISQQTGLYTDAGIGVNLFTKRNNAFVFSVGYSYKHVAEKQQGFSWQPWPQPAGSNVLNYDYHFNRIAIKAGLMF